MHADIITCTYYHTYRIKKTWFEMQNFYKIRSEKSAPTII